MRFCLAAYLRNKFKIGFLKVYIQHYFCVQDNVYEVFINISKYNLKIKRYK